MEVAVNTAYTANTAYIAFTAYTALEQKGYYAYIIALWASDNH